MIWPSLGRLLAGVLSLRCVGCGQRTVPLCPACQAAATFEPVAVCPHCQRPQRAALVCPRCYEPDSLDGGFAAYHYVAPLGDAIRQLKYKGRRSLVAPLTEMVATRLSDGPPWLTAGRLDLIVPVPLHQTRERQRGFNQAAVLAAELAPTLGLQHLPHALHRQRATRPQVGLNEAARQQNVVGAFAPGPEAAALAGRRVLLFDDVYTTGATLRECVRAARAAGASKVYALTIARAKSGDRR